MLVVVYALHGADSNLSKFSIILNSTKLSLEGPWC